MKSNVYFYVLFYINLQIFQKSLCEYNNNYDEYNLPYGIKNSDDIETMSASSIKYDDHLIRKRRYLQFPEGSSFQIVYDLVIGVVDYTNYLILGVTVALAWELPTKPPSEILIDLEERLKAAPLNLKRNDTLQIQNNVENTEPWRKSSIYTNNLMQSSKPHYYQYVNGKSPYKSYKINPLLNKNVDYSHFHRTESNSKFPTWNVNSSLKGGKQDWKTLKHLKKPFNTNERFFPIKHKILPIFGKKYAALHSRHKRSGIDTTELSKWDRIHIRYQRSTRHTLYESIEKYLQGRGLNGHHCVLRALCETGQKSHEVEPGSFVGEIMRAIFTMPEPLEDDLLDNRLSYKERRYDIANSLTSDCAQRYHLCKESLWSSYFVI